MTDWSDAKLDAMRQVGDPRADDVVAQLFATRESGEVSALFHRLTTDDEPIPDQLPDIIRTFFEDTGDLPAFADRALITRGEELFAVHGMSMVCGLFCSALPHAYCAHRGATVLVETGRMVGDFTRRIVETAQFVMDVMAPGGLAGDGRGLRTTQKVRLIHAALRYLVTHRRQWPTHTLGVPINQEDLAGTLLTFSTVILDALDTLELEVSDGEREAYLHAWRCVGHLLGIRADMIPTDVADARALYAAIVRRQFGASAQGTLLTQALLDAMATYVPGDAFDGATAVYVRHFLGDALADSLGVPPPNWTELVFRAQASVARIFDHVTERSPLIAHLFGGFNRAIMESLSVAYRSGKGVGFRIPSALRQRWQLSDA
ncbi:MAG TPA: oxygenase MpaB family protein [Kofleriaceae bacterium]|nr:oxygenase MpaB family protein [Kofleriaceae bacterium]